MNTNFAGLGLPTPIYLTVTNLLKELEDDLTCSDGISGYCTISETCSSYLSEFNTYSFYMKFSTNSADYMRVPLAAFTQDVNGTCQILITNLDSSMVDASSIVLGGMFFQNFFGVFTNHYDATPVT